MLRTVQAKVNDSNRCTTDVALYNEMGTKGRISEGLAFCAAFGRAVADTTTLGKADQRR